MDTAQTLATIAHAIQLAIAPVFLLTGVGSLLGVMANRLGRIVDRARIVESNWNVLTDDERPGADQELASLLHRATSASWAINLCAFAALLVCALIAALFAEEIWKLTLRWLVAALFILAMIALSAGVICFLREVHVATRTLRIGPPSRQLTK